MDKMYLRINHEPRKDTHKHTHSERNGVSEREKGRKIKQGIEETRLCFFFRHNPLVEIVCDGYEESRRQQCI